jgi:excisionase family DNA binding protein
MAARGMTLAQVRKLPATVDLSTAAQALGVGRSTIYEAVRSGRCPVKTITVGTKVKVLTLDLIRVLEGGDGAT